MNIEHTLFRYFTKPIPRCRPIVYVLATFWIYVICMSNNDDVVHVLSQFIANNMYVIYKIHLLNHDNDI